MKKDKILSNILFFFGIVLFLYTLFALTYQIILTIRINWGSLKGDDLTDMRSYVIIQFVTIAFKLVISSYAMYSHHHVDDAINPLFTFTIFYLLFVILETMSLVNTLNGKTFKQIASDYKFVVSTAAIDLIVVVFFVVVTLLLKADDWRTRQDE